MCGISANRTLLNNPSNNVTTTTNRNLPQNKENPPSTNQDNLQSNPSINTVDMSRSANARLDSSSSSTVNPVEINFGTPASRSNNISSDRSVSSTHSLTLAGSGRFPLNFNISTDMNTYLNNNVLNSRSPRISTEQFSQLNDFARSTNNSDDVRLVESLNNLSETRRDGNTRRVDITSSNGLNTTLEIYEPRSNDQSRSISNPLNSLRDNLVQGVPLILGQAAMNLYNRDNPMSPLNQPFRPYTIAPAPEAGFRISNSSGIDSNNRFGVNVGLQYSTPVGSNANLSLQAGYGTSVFTVPSFMTYGRDNSASTFQANGGFNATATLNVGDNARFSYNTETGFEAAANFDVGNDNTLSVGYNQNRDNRDGLFVRLGRTF